MIKRQKTVFKGKLLTVLTTQVKLPNSYLANLEVISHPGAVLIIPFISPREIIFLRQYRPVIDSYIYELPAGTLDKGESLLKCAQREIIEETGYSAKKMKRLGEIVPVPGYSTERITIFKAEGLKEVKGLRKQDDEVIEIFIVTRSRLRRLFKSGKLIDAKTICALAFCGWL